eukprot:3373845-Amphidinium_carterae.1
MLNPFGLEPRTLMHTSVIFHTVPCINVGSAGCCNKVVENIEDNIVQFIDVDKLNDDTSDLDDCQGPISCLDVIDD